MSGLGKNEKLGFMRCGYYYKLGRGNMIKFTSSTDQDLNNEPSMNFFEQILDQLCVKKECEWSGKKLKIGFYEMWLLLQIWKR